MSGVGTDQRARGSRVEGVLDDDRYILMIYREDCWRVDDLCTEVAELHSLDKRQLVDDVSIVDDTRVGCHEAIDIGPYLEHLCLKGSSHDGSGIV